MEYWITQFGHYDTNRESCYQCSCEILVGDSMYIGRFKESDIEHPFCKEECVLREFHHDDPEDLVIKEAILQRHLFSYNNPKIIDD